ncbi:hypothetical protein HDU76_000533 [Blyttiomyces sp. JEL0837]|nr:hypothetical protein HDU76_000533 [Blyttiomyces sp. JEL0837]
MTGRGSGSTANDRQGQQGQGNNNNSNDIRLTTSPTQFTPTGQIPASPTLPVVVTPPAPSASTSTPAGSSSSYNYYPRDRSDLALPRKSTSTSGRSSIASQEDTVGPMPHFTRGRDPAPGRTSESSSRSVSRSNFSVQLSEHTRSVHTDEPEDPSDMFQIDHSQLVPQIADLPRGEHIVHHHNGVDESHPAVPRDGRQYVEDLDLIDMSDGLETVSTNPNGSRQRTILRYIFSLLSMIYYMLISGGVKTGKVKHTQLEGDFERAKLKENKHSVWSIMARTHPDPEDLKQFIEDEKWYRWRRHVLKTHRLKIGKQAKEVKSHRNSIASESGMFWNRKKNNGPSEYTRSSSAPLFKTGFSMGTRSSSFGTPPSTPSSPTPSSSTVQPHLYLHEWQKEISRKDTSIDKVLHLLDAPNHSLDDRARIIRDGILAELDRWYKVDEEGNKRLLELYAKEIIMERGPDGETILHYALINRRALMLQYLLGYGKYAKEEDRFPYLSCLINKVYEGAVYWGQHVCHIAVVSYGDNITMLKRLVERGADVHKARARGIFFQEEGGDFYMGETVLAFAAVMGHQRIVNYLIRELLYDPNVTDSRGNTVLHVLAWHGYYSNHREWHSNPKKSKTPPVKIVKGKIYDQLASGGDAIFDNPRMPADALSDDARVEFENEFMDDDVKAYFEAEKQKALQPHVDQTQPQRQPQYTDSTKELNLTPEQSKLIHECRSADDTLANDAKLTPLIVAASKGKASMVQALLDYKMEPMWTYGSIRKTRLNLGELDTFREEATMNHEKGALEIAVRNNDSDIVSLPVFQRLLECKWSLYGERVALWRFFNQLTYLIVFTIALALLPNDASYYGTDTQNRSRLDYGKAFGRLFITGNSIDENNNYVYDQDVKQFFRFFLEITLVIWSVFNFVRECNEVRAAGIRRYFTGFGWFENILQWVDIVLFFMGFGFRFAVWNFAETVTWGLYAIMAWASLLNSASISSTFGCLTVILWRIITLDVVNFGIILTVFLFGFGSALWLEMAPFADFVYNSQNDGVDITQPPNVGYTEWRRLIPGALVWWIRLFLGQGANFDDYRNSGSAFTLVLFLSFALLINILLVNVFIAMINQTFSKIIGESERQWRLMWANTIMEMDEKINSRDAKSRKKDSKRPYPITRIGIPNIATVFKPAGWLAQKEDSVAAQAKKLFKWFGGRSNGQDSNGGSQSQSAQGQTKEIYYNFEFLLEYRTGSDLPLHVTASLDYDSPLSVAHSFESFQNSTGWSTAVGGWASQGISSTPRKIKTRRA